MPQLQPGQVDFSLGQATALEELAGAPQRLVNLVTDDSKYLSLVPGSSAWNWFPSTIPNASEVIGISSFRDNLVWVTADRKIWALTSPTTAVRLDQLAYGTLSGTSRPVFASSKNRIYITGGARIQYWEPPTGSYSGAIPIPYGPSYVSSVLVNSQRLVVTAGDNSGQIQWTEALENLQITVDGWNPLNFAEAETRPDPALRAFENSNEVFVFGTQTLQAFAPDPNVAYAPTVTINVGTKSPDSIINLLDQRLFAWFTNYKEIVLGDGRGEPAVISAPIDKVLKSIETFDDAIGWRIRIGNVDMLVWKFPTDGRTFAYEQNSKKWLELAGYDTATGGWAPWPVTAYYHWEEEDVHLAGLATGEIVKLDADSLLIAGQPIVGEATSGFINRGSESLHKQSVMLTAPVRRGVGSFGSTPPFVEISWRDGTGTWAQPLQISLGAADDTQPVVRKRLVGRPYFKRQWRLRASGARVSIGPLEELFEVLGG